MIFDEKANIYVRKNTESYANVSIDSNSTSRNSTDSISKKTRVTFSCTKTIYEDLTE